MANRFVSPEQQFINNFGQPYAGGFLYFYISGTSTPTPTYQDQALTTPNTNPVVLDSAGNAGNIFLNSSIVYKVVLTDSGNNTIWTFDPVIPTDAPSSALVNGVISCTPSGGPNAITLTAINASQQPSVYANYTIFAFVPSVTTTGAVTVQVGSLAFYPVFLASGLQANANDFVAGSGPYFIAYGSIVAGATPGFLLLNQANSQKTQSISTNTTVGNQHDNSVLSLTNNITLTFPAANTLANGFTCTVVNSEIWPNGGPQGAAQLLTVNGNTYYLYPGMSYDIFTVGSSWGSTPQLGQRFVVPAGGGNPGQGQTFGVTLFVSNSGNDNTNDGLSASRPLQTIGRAHQFMRNNFDHNTFYPQISVANGTYIESIQSQGPLVGTLLIFLTGASASGVIWKPVGNVNTTYCLLLSDGAIFEISNVKFDGVGLPANQAQYGVFMHQYSIIDFNAGCEFGAFSNYHVSSDHAGVSVNFNASYAISNSNTMAAHILMGPCCCTTVSGGTTITITNSPQMALFYQATGSGAGIYLSPSITYSGGPATGCQKWGISSLAFLQLNGNTVPGSVAGAPVAGSSPFGSQVSA